jgi:two-component system, LytTR family, sensor kinase
MRRNPTGFWRLQIGAWVAFGAAMSLGRAGEFPASILALVELPFALLGFITTLILTRVFVRLELGTDSSARMLSLIALVSLGGGMLWTASFHTYFHNVAIPLMPVFSPGFEVPFLRGPLLDNTVYNSLTMLAWSTLYVGLSYRDALFEQQERALRAVAEARDAQLQMLAYQLNPHFLFNTLNSVRALIDEDRDRARLMVTELARFLRYALVDRPLHLAQLSEEIDALRGYLAVESVRFEDRLEVRVEVQPAAAECLVPAFLLNPLVENALKHGVPVAGGEPLRVSVDARLTSRGTLAIVVENSGRLGEPKVSPTAALGGGPALLNGHGGLGVRNVRARLEHLFPGRHRFDLEQVGDLVRVSMELPALDDERTLQPTEA